MPEIARTAKSKARQALITVLLIGTVIGLGATAANAILRGVIERVERSEVMLERLEAQAYRLSALQWQVISEEGMTPETFDEVRSARTDLTRTLRDLELQEPDASTFDPVRRAYAAYTTAVDEEFEFMRAGRFDEARLLERERVDPAFTELRNAITPARDYSHERTVRLDHLSLVGFAIILFFANAATVLLFWGFQRARRAAGRALAETDFLAKREESTRLLGEMSDRLRASSTTKEAYEVVAQSAALLLPEDSGALYIYDGSRDILEPVSIWGQYPRHLLDRPFEREECLALRRHRAYRLAEDSDEPRCGHVAGTDAAGYVCVPLFSHGDTLGVLHLRHTGSSPSPQEEASAAVWRWPVAIEIADRAALALVNMKLEEALREQATLDPLSGLCNRRFMEATFDHELARAERHHTPMSVVMLDVDNLKSINDKYGHSAGDEAIVELSSLLRGTFREEDIICRYGGDEFVVVLPGITLNDAQRRAERLQESVRRWSDERISQELPGLRVSLGISAFPQHGQTSDRLIDVADAAMYQAKAEGRDRLVVASEDDRTGGEP